MLQDLLVKVSEKTAFQWEFLKGIFSRRRKREKLELQLFYWIRRVSYCGEKRSNTVGKILRARHWYSLRFSFSAWHSTSWQADGPGEFWTRWWTMGTAQSGFSTWSCRIPRWQDLWSHSSHTWVISSVDRDVQSMLRDHLVVRWLCFFSSCLWIRIRRASPTWVPTLLIYPFLDSIQTIKPIALHTLKLYPWRPVNVGKTKSPNLV